MRIVALWALAIAGCSGMPSTGADDAGASAGDFATAIDLGATGDLAFTPASHPPFPQFPGSAAGEIVPLKLVTVVSAGDPLASQLFAFSDALIASDWWKAISADWQLGTPTVSVHVTGAALTGDQSDVAMVTYVGESIMNDAGAVADGNTMYLLYLPPGSNAISNGVTNTDCILFGGYHHGWDDQGNAFGMVQRCANSTEAELSHLTAIGSHEIAESATDTGKGYRLGQQPMQPWLFPIWRSYETGNIETGDLCEGTRIAEGGFVYQRIWSNRASALGGDPCIPSLPGAYFDVSAPMDWYALAAGAKVVVPLTGWSTAATADWAIGTIAKNVSGPAWTFATDSPTHEMISPKMRATTNNGRAATLTLTAPAGAPSGSFSVFEVRSYTPTTSGNLPTDDSVDFYHYWLVGAYVP